MSQKIYILLVPRKEKRRKSRKKQQDKVHHHHHHSQRKRLSLPTETNKDSSSLRSGQVEDLTQTERLVSGKEQLTLITESMSITSADQEKLQLLNKNTELRRLNKELMKLNEDWDHIYRRTSAGLQQRVAALEQEISALKQLNSRLLIKVEHEQNKSEYYEHTLMQELKKNQHLQEYIRLLESRLQHIDTMKGWALGIQNKSAVISQPEMHVRERSPKSPTPSAASLDLYHRTRSSRTHSECQEKQNDASKEVQDLKEQLQALRCQTKIYEADYKIEHKDHERMLQENKRLRRREGEMRQQMALLQEQLKVYEDDFHKERSDKQLLQRLLMKKAPAVQEPALIHRCNNDQERIKGERRRTRDEHGAVFMCPKHCDNRGHLEYP